MAPANPALDVTAGCGEGALPKFNPSNAGVQWEDGPGQSGKQELEPGS
jgi:hypothetical protein